MQKLKPNVRLVEERVCPTCNAKFESGKNYTHCPEDLTLLCPVTVGHTGLTVGNWTVLEMIGEGASGRVYRAVDEQTNMVAAIKFLKLSFQSDPTAVKRFQQEALAIKQLTIGSITSLFDFGILDDGTPYLVMELVRGRTLQQILELQGSLSNETARTIFLQIAEAMEEAHAHGILHRDLKPGNLIIDEKLNVKIVDFGLAKFCDSDLAASVTRTGVSLGTPAYMSPEQCTGEEVDHRSDIYSIGCVMYECLTNRPVFETEKALGFYHKHAFEVPVEPSKHLGKAPHIATREFKQLEQIVMACLRKVPGDRIQSMRELQEALKGKPVRAVRRKMPPFNKPALAGVLSAIALIAVATFCTPLFTQKQTPSIGIENFVPPHAVVTKATQKTFVVPDRLSFDIRMEDRPGVGYQNHSQLLRKDDTQAAKLAMEEPSAKECFGAWRDYYFNIFSLVRSFGAVPADLRMKIDVAIDADGKVSVNQGWQDQNDNPATLAYVDKVINGLRKMDKTSLVVFPSSSVERVDFEIYFGSSSELKLSKFEQDLR
ncbi:MAG: serine/threonine-protein kinase [Candidatus Melainabacteria bacterium]|nr:serine/threonine-protein kinase [Candidatus Melainabacteria bacterium]